MKFLFKYTSAFILGILFSCSLISCQRGKKAETGDKISIDIHRFERDLFSIDLYNLPDSLKELYEAYPDFFPLFTNKVISIGDSSDEGFSERLLAFITDFTNYKVSRRVNQVFPSMEPFENQFSISFSQFKYEFPEKEIPQIITCITGFNQSVITTEKLLAISLDKYLGEEEEFYRLLYPPVPEYMRMIMRPEKIVPDAMLAWIITSFEYNDEKDNLLSSMIFNGRAMYALKQLMPDVNDSLLWGYTSEQLEFCSDNERSMWEFLVEKKRLFETDQFILNQYINEAPFTKDFTRNSPGRAAVWIGYRIVESYASKNKNLSIKDIMQEMDYQKILNNSKYNP